MEKDKCKALQEQIVQLESDNKEAMELLDYAFGFLKLLYGNDTAHLDRYERLKDRKTW